MRMLTPWTTRSLASELFNEMDRFFDDVNLAPPTGAYDERSFAPACEVAEADEHYVMSIDLPGMKKEEIKIEVNDHTLTISGERKREAANKAEKVQRYEKSYGYFKRSFGLPSSVDTDRVEAKYEDGVLELYLPKVQSAKPRQISIGTGKSGIFNKLLGSKKSDESKESPTKAS